MGKWGTNRGQSCSECDAPALSRGLCGKHYSKLRKYGSVGGGTTWDPWLRYEKNCVKGSGCWEWTGGTDGNGYATFSVAGKKWRVGRWWWTQTHGPLPSDVFICHHCDNPGCVNPEHLYAGNQRTNMADMRARHRNHSRAILTVEQVQAVKRAKGSTSARELATRYSVSVWCIYDIWRGRKWGWVEA